MDVSSQRFDVLGVKVNTLDLGTATRLIHDTAEAGGKGYATFTGVHGVIESQDNAEFREILNKSLLTGADGMPLVWLGRRAAGDQVGRVYGPDAMLSICEASVASGHRHFFFGGGDQVAPLLAEKLVQRFPGLQVAGTYTPPFRPLNEAEGTELIAHVAQTKPHYFWVGISTPKQELFMDEWLHKLDANIMLGVGAAFDFHSGLKRQAPVWMQRSGLEWLFRTVTEPRRLASRYLTNNTRFIGLLLKEALKKRDEQS
ncbi:MAG: WecB/TagA/CpsF family glycosyltransferase [Verrucomicrobiota bacterium]